MHVLEFLKTVIFEKEGGKVKVHRDC